MSIKNLKKAMDVVKRLSKFTYKGLRPRPNMEGVFVDSFYGNAVVTNGIYMLIIKMESSEDVYYLDGAPNPIHFVPYLSAVPTYDKAAEIDVTDWLRLIKPLARASRKSKPTCVGIVIDGVACYYNAKMLYDGLTEIESKTATLCFDSPDVALGIYSGASRFLIHPHWSDEDCGEVALGVDTTAAVIPQPDVEHYRENEVVWGFIRGRDSLPWLKWAASEGTNKDEYLARLKDRIQETLSLSGPYDQKLMTRLASYL